MSRGSGREREAAEAAAEFTRRAIRRLDILEWVFLAGAAGMSVAGGGLVAWLLVQGGGPPFRTVWIVASLLLFVVPGAIVMTQNRRAESDDALGRDTAHPEEGDG